MKAQVAAWKTAKHQRAVVRFDCQHCGLAVERTVGVNGKASFCSRSCKDMARKQAMKDALAASKPARTCLHCAAEMPDTMRIDAAYCSPVCNDAAHALVRKMARRAGSPKLRLSRAALGDRDNWRCGICGGAVDRTKKHPDPLAPSVDHIVPLASGGTNTTANLQLAHLRCNLAKGSR